MFDLSHHKFRGAVLSLEFGALCGFVPKEVSEDWVHTLNLTLHALVDISSLGSCGSLHTLKLSHCYDMSWLTSRRWAVVTICTR